MKIPNLLYEEINRIMSSSLKSQQLTKSDKISKIYNLFIKKNERDVINLLLRIENDLDDETILELLKDAERSPMFKVRVYLH